MNPAVYQEEMGKVFGDFAAALSQGLPPDSEPVQAIVLRLHTTASKAWTGPIGRGGFLNISESYARNPEVRARFESRAPALADDVARAMRIFRVEAEPWPGAA